MNTRFLFPHSFKKIGWILLIPSTVFGLAIIVFDFQFDFLNLNLFSFFGNSFSAAQNNGIILIKNNLTDELTALTFIIGGLFVGFSKQKTEDEYIAKIRLESLLWATYVNYLFLIIALFLIYELSFFTFMCINMFTILIFFILRFHFMLLKLNLAHREK